MNYLDKYEGFIADVDERKFVMLSDIDSISGFSLYELMSPDDAQKVKRDDPVFTRAYTAAKKLMP